MFKEESGYKEQFVPANLAIGGKRQTQWEQYVGGYNAWQGNDNHKDDENELPIKIKSEPASPPSSAVTTEATETHSDDDNNMNDVNNDNDGSIEDNNGNEDDASDASDENEVDKAKKRLAGFFVNCTINTMPMEILLCLSHEWLTHEIKGNWELLVQNRWNLDSKEFYMFKLWDKFKLCLPHEYRLLSMYQMGCEFALIQFALGNPVWFGDGALEPTRENILANPFSVNFKSANQWDLQLNGGPKMFTMKEDLYGFNWNTHLAECARSLNQEKLAWECFGFHGLSVHLCASECSMMDMMCLMQMFCCLIFCM